MWAVTVSAAVEVIWYVHPAETLLKIVLIFDLILVVLAFQQRSDLMRAPATTSRTLKLDLPGAARNHLHSCVLSIKPKSSSRDMSFSATIKLRSRLTATHGNLYSFAGRLGLSVEKLQMVRL